MPKVPPRFSARVAMLRIPLPALGPSLMPTPSSTSENEIHSSSIETTASTFDALACRPTFESASAKTWRRWSLTMEGTTKSTGPRKAIRGRMPRSCWYRSAIRSISSRSPVATSLLLGRRKIVFRICRITSSRVPTAVEMRSPIAPEVVDPRAWSDMPRANNS